jgi:hypothetical protein
MINDNILYSYFCLQMMHIYVIVGFIHIDYLGAKTNL